MSLNETRRNKPKNKIINTVWIFCNDSIYVKLVVAIVGLVTSIFTFFISFVPPTSIANSMVQSYEYMWMLIISCLVALVLPFAIYAFCQKYMHAHEGNVHHAVATHKY